MTRHPRMGGLGLPDLCAYHIAMTLDQMKHWWHNSPNVVWTEMEAGVLGTSDWRAVILDPFPEQTPLPRYSPTRPIV